ncbi:MAG: zinc metallopeptidase [Armatimonadetes bacterium]|nr:zinc metallopeptidase [Armatimonadota bacterium]
MFFDSTFLILIPGVLLAFYAQWKVRSTYNRYLEVPASVGLTGAEVAARILARRGAPNVKVEPVEGMLSDHYDPRGKVLRLSPENYYGHSIAALGVSAHEAGHAIQDAEGYRWLVVRSAMVPVANIGSNLAWILFMIGLFFAQFRVLMDVGILLFTGAVLFSIITLPVEFDASRRAVAVLGGEGLVTPRESEGVQAVLNAAALTYVAAAAMAVLQLLRLIMLRNSREE